MDALRFLRVLVGGGAVGGYRRTGYLIVTVAIAVATWLALSTLASVVLGGSGVGHAVFPGVYVSTGNPGHQLPLRYMRRIEKIPGTRVVSWGTIIAFDCAPMTRAVASTVGGPGTITRVLYLTTRDDHPGVDAATLARWRADPLGILVSRRTARECGWHTGQGIDPPNGVGRNIALHVSGIFMASALNLGAFVHYDYINRIGGMELIGKNFVMFAYVRGPSVRDSPQLAKRITAAFAHDSPTVYAASDVTAQNAAARFGKVQQLLAFVMAAVLLCAVSILISVLAHSAAQRRPRFALLQVLGFGRGTLFVTVVLESTLIIVIGTLIGIALGLALAHFISVGTAVGRLFTGYDFTPPSWSYRWMLPWLAGLLVAGLIAPALVIRRSRPVDHRGG